MSLLALFINKSRKEKLEVLWNIPNETEQNYYKDLLIICFCNMFL